MSTSFVEVLSRLGVTNQAGQPLTLGDPELRGAHQITTEQTNTSFVLPSLKSPEAPNGAILKVFKTATPSPHPDVQVPVALHDVGYANVPKVLKVLTEPNPSIGLTDSAVLCEYIPNAVDGFSLACEYAGRGQPFVAPATTLGQTIAELHQALAKAFPEAALVQPAVFVESLLQRGATALATVPELDQYQNQITQLYQNLKTHLASKTMQRIHGDLHLGQMLFQTLPHPKPKSVWYVLDFEGEPLRPAAERKAPDLPERDLAGMIRSFGYAAAVGGADQTWADQATAAFLTGYQQHRAFDPTILAALTLDKALYEAVYESIHRKDWMYIPIAAIHQLLTEKIG